MQAIHLQKLGKSKWLTESRDLAHQMTAWELNCSMYTTTTENIWWCYLNFTKKVTFHTPINTDTSYTLCCAKDLEDSALFQRTVGLGHISTLWRSLLLVHFQRFPQWGSPMGIHTSSPGNTFRISLACITCISQDSQYFEMLFLLLSSPIWKMLLTLPASCAQHLDISCEQPFSCTCMVYLDLYLPAHILSLQQSRCSSLLFCAGSFSLMRSCYETLLGSRCCW